MLLAGTGRRDGWREGWLLILTTAEGSAAPDRLYEALSCVNGKINGEQIPPLVVGDQLQFTCVTANSSHRL